MRARNVAAAVITVAAVTLVAGSVALAAGNGPFGMAGMPGPGMRGPDGGLGLPLHRLDLTDDQRDAIRAIVDAEQPALRELREQVQASRQAFMEAHPPTEFDEAAIRAHAAEQAPLLADLAVAEARVRAKALALLTPEQVTELKAMRSRMHERLERVEHRRGR